MSKSKKILLVLIGIVLIAALSLLGWWYFRYYSYNAYQQYLTAYDYEEGTDFVKLSEEESDVVGMVLAAENDTLKLYANVSTGEVAIVDKRNGQITYSNPVDADEDAIANATNLSYMKSQLIVDYFNTSRTTGTYDSYSYCTSLDQLEVEAIEDGIRFIYTIGDMSASTGIVPEYISEETLNDVMSKLSEDDAKEVAKKYTAGTTSGLADGYLELLESAKKGASQLRKLNKYFEEAGFTTEDYLREMEGSGIEGAVPISFEIPLEYRLVDDGVEATIPMSQVVENGGGAIYRIQMLRYFGAAGTEEDGYMLVPNGSGSIIYFNNGKNGTSVSNYSEYVYGIDPLMAEYTVLENSENAKMALFGLFREESAVFATIEDGASLAYISAGVSGKINSYNYVYSTFVLRGNEKLSMFGTTGNEADLPVVEDEFYDANLTIRYTMLTEDDADYSGAANYYRNRLVAEGVLIAQESEEGEDIKFYYDILGGVNMTKYFLGTQYNGIYAMTTYAQAQEISEDLAANGITNQVMNFQGWMNGGYYHSVVDQINLPSALGSKSKLEDLSEALSEIGGTFYADVAFQKVTEISKRYAFSTETARYYGSGYIADFGLVNPTTLRQTSGLGYEENRYVLISPKYLVRYINSFASKISNYDISGISLRDLASELHSDKKRTNVIDREEALDVVLGSLTEIEETGKNVLLNAANDYSFAYADDIINVPLSGNDYYIIDEDVPFYEMLLHGYVDYAGDVVNLSDSSDETDIILSLIENGASPHYMFSYQSSNEIKNTGVNYFYSTTYSNWSDDALYVYNEVNEALKYVNGAEMVKHEILSSNVRAVTYSNGVTIYINTGTADEKANGVTVPARSYTVKGA
ncbi:MAG: DUF5696 domain-containing protein [Lachnospiraceae bacterium]|nr:DUF5696 domain-containing protein [Lachnospiraceae bacterium]